MKSKDLHKEEDALCRLNTATTSERLVVGTELREHLQVWVCCVMLLCDCVV